MESAYEELDRKLHALEESELLAVNGEVRDLSAFQRCMADGQEVLMMEYCGTSGTFPYRHPCCSLVKTTRFTDTPLHIHSWVEIGYMHSGSITNVIGGKEYHIREGQIFLLDSDVPHSLGYAGENDILISILLYKPFFLNHFLNRFTSSNVISKFLISSISEQYEHNNYMLFRSENNRCVRYAMNELMMEHISPSQSAQDKTVSLITLLFLELVNIFNDELQESRPDQEQNKVLPIVRYINDNFRKCDLKSTAAEFGFTPNYMTALLKRCTGYSFKELVQQQRYLFVTMQLLNTNLPVDEILYESGCSNTTYFYRKFKEKYDCSPSEYRKRDGGLHINQ